MRLFTGTGRGLEDSSVSKASQAGSTEFDFQDPCKKPSTEANIYKPSIPTESWEERQRQENYLEVQLLGQVGL